MDFYSLATGELCLRMRALVELLFIGDYSKFITLHWSEYIMNQAGYEKTTSSSKMK